MIFLSMQPDPKFLARGAAQIAYMRSRAAMRCLVVKAFRLFRFIGFRKKSATL